MQQVKIHRKDAGPRKGRCTSIWHLVWSGTYTIKYWGGAGGWRNSRTCLRLGSLHQCGTCRMLMARSSFYGVDYVFSISGAFRVVTFRSVVGLGICERWTAKEVAKVNAITHPLADTCVEHQVIFKVFLFFFKYVVSQYFCFLGRKIFDLIIKSLYEHFVFINSRMQ